jgi:DNA-binding IclR family transcriptional regulator
MREKQSSQERTLALVEWLSAKKLAGATNKEIAIGMKVSPVIACRDMAVLQEFGWVERKPDGVWRMSPKFGRFAAVIAQAFKDQLLELKAEEDRFLGTMEGRHQ